MFNEKWKINNEKQNILAMVQNCIKFSQMMQNGPKPSECVRNGLQASKMVQNNSK